MTLAFFVLTQYGLVTDRQRDRHVAIAIARASIASRGYKNPEIARQNPQIPS